MPSKAKLWSSKSHCYKLWISENLEKQFRTTSYKCNDAYVLYPEYSSENSPYLSSSGNMYEKVWYGVDKMAPKISALVTKPEELSLRFNHGGENGLPLASTWMP